MRGLVCACNLMENILSTERAHVRIKCRTSLKKLSIRFSCLTCSIIIICAEREKDMWRRRRREIEREKE